MTEPNESSTTPDPTSHDEHRTPLVAALVSAFRDHGEMTAEQVFERVKDLPVFDAEDEAGKLAEAEAALADRSVFFDQREELERLLEDDDDPAADSTSGEEPVA